MRRLAATRAATIVGALAVAVTGCGGPERSAEAYCKAFYSKAAPIRQGYIDAGQTAKTDPLGATLKLLQAPGDFVSILDAMVDHAPDAIKSDTVEVRDSLKKVQDTMGQALSNPLGALGGGLAASLTSAGAYRRVNEYLNEHCPVNSPLAQKIIRESSH